MDFEILETQRLQLRKLTPEVYDHLYSNYSDQDCMNYLGIRNLEQLQEAKAKYAQGLAAHDRTFVNFLLIEKETGNIIGDSGFVRYYPAHFRAELGYSLMEEEHKRKGYMYEANVSILEFGFKELNLIRVEAYTGVYNEASIKLLQKLGFEKEGVMKKHYHRNGVSEDSIVFSKLRE